jgi:hypothetical protein
VEGGALDLLIAFPGYCNADADLVVMMMMMMMMMMILNMTVPKYWHHQHKTMELLSVL